MKRVLYGYDLAGGNRPRKATKCVDDGDPPEYNTCNMIGHTNEGKAQQLLSLALSFKHKRFSVPLSFFQLFLSFSNGV